MNYKIYSKKSRSFGMFLIFTCLFITLIAYGQLLLKNDSYSALDFIIPSLIVTPVLGLFLWIWKATYYLIHNEILIAKSGPLIWKVPIKEITLIRLNQDTIGGTWKLTLSWSCIEVKYNKYRSIFISPSNEGEFLERILKINSKIDIRQK